MADSQCTSTTGTSYVIDDGDGQPDANDFAGDDWTVPSDPGMHLATSPTCLAKTHRGWLPILAPIGNQPLAEEEMYFIWFQVSVHQYEWAALPTGGDRPDSVRLSADDSMGWSDGAFKFSTGEVRSAPNAVEGLMSQSRPSDATPGTTTGASTADVEQAQFSVPPLNPTGYEVERAGRPTA